MKKIMLIAVLIFVFYHVLGQEYICLKDGTISHDTPVTFTERRIENTDKGIIANYELHYATICPDSKFLSASVLHIDGFGIPEGYGIPALPRRLDRFAIPRGEPYKIVITDSSYIELPMEIAPARPCTVGFFNKSNSQSIVTQMKAYSGFYPECVVSATLNEYRSNGILDIEVCPVQYNYLTKTVRIYFRLSYLVEFDQSKMEGTAYMHSNTNTDPLLANTMMNPRSSMRTNEGTRSVNTYEQITPPGYLIITVPQYIDAVNKLITWKRTLGFNVFLSCQNSWTETTVRNVVNSTNSSNPINYLLIVGDFEDVPGKAASNTLSTPSGNVTLNFYTDYYYGCLAQNNYATIKRGRLPVSNSSEAMTVVDKIIQYEREPITDASFYETGLNCAEFEDDNTDSYEDDRFTLTSEKIRDLMVNEVGKSVKRVYKANSSVYPRYWENNKYGFHGQSVMIPSELLRENGYPWNGISDSIAEHINNGVFYALHEGHGADLCWGGPIFYKSDINSLSNGKRLPVVFSMNCLTGEYNGKTCFAEAFLRKNNGGCVAIFAPSSSSPSGYDDALTLGMFDAIWPSLGYFKSFPYGNTITLSTTPTYRLGDILDCGLFKIPNIFDNYSTTAYKHTREIFHCFGDPAMEIYTEAPTPFEDVVFHKNNGTLYLTLQENATISFFNTSTGAVDVFYGSSVSYPDATNLRICVSAHNKIPLIINNGILYLQNEYIASSINYEADEIQAGTNVTIAKSPGDVFITNSNSVLKGNSIELHDNTTISANAQVEIRN